MTDDDPPSPRRLGFDRLLAEFAADAAQSPAPPARVDPPARRRPTRIVNAGTRRRATAAGGLILLVVVIAAGTALRHTSPPVLGSRLVAASTAGSPIKASAFARSEIPASYLRLYVRAAAEYHLDWATLAAVGQIESRQGRSVFPGVSSGTNTAGAAGPAQFLSTTWDRFGVDGDSDGQINPYDPADAIPSMAAYLRVSGAPEDWPKALFAYNHSQSYVDSVLAMSRRFDPDASPPATS